MYTAVQNTNFMRKDVMEQGTVQVDELKFLHGWNVKLERAFGVEARGIERVLESDKPPKATFADFVQIVLIWFSANLTLNNLAIGLLGPLVFGLSLTEAMLVGTFGTIAGTLGTAYQSTWGPVSGNRTMVSLTRSIFPRVIVSMADYSQRLSHATRWAGGRPRSAYC